MCGRQPENSGLFKSHGLASSGEEALWIELQLGVGGGVSPSGGLSPEEGEGGVQK